MDLTLRLLIFCWLIAPVTFDVFCKKQHSQIPLRPGSTVTMPCKFTIDENVRSNTSVSWQKIHGEDVLVVAFHNIPDDDANQHQNYKGRAHIHSEWPNSGHPDLLLQNVSDADIGNYTCYITYGNWPYECSSVVIHDDQGKPGSGLTESSIIMIMIAGFVLVAVVIVALSFFVCNSHAPQKKTCQN